MRLVSRIHPSDLPADLGHLLDHLLGGSAAPRGFAPRTDIEEAEQQFLVSVELPGLDPEQVNVEVADDCLTISGEKTPRPSDAKFHRTERCGGTFERKFEFPVQVDFEKIDAHFEKGVLTIAVPKSEKILPRKIEVKTGG